MWKYEEARNFGLFPWPEHPLSTRTFFITYIGQCNIFRRAAYNGAASVGQYSGEESAGAASASLFVKAHAYWLIGI